MLSSEQQVLVATSRQSSRNEIPEALVRFCQRHRRRMLFWERQQVVEALLRHVSKVLALLSSLLFQQEAEK
jgi:hypothetical protein